MQAAYVHARSKLASFGASKAGSLLQGMHVAQHDLAICLSPVSHIAFLALRHIEHPLVLHASDVPVWCCLAKVWRRSVGLPGHNEGCKPQGL